MIEDLSEQEKSVMLARAMGWEYNVVGDDIGHGFAVMCDSSGEMIWTEGFDYPDAYPYKNLYDPANMALAWRVLNWLSAEGAHLSDYSYPYDTDDTVELMFTDDFTDPLWKLPPDEAQGVWLDKCLKIAIKAKLVQLDEKERQAPDV